MSSSITEKIRELVRPPHPTWACEFTARHLVLAGVDGKRSRVEARTAQELAPGTVLPSLSDRNIKNPEAVRSALENAIRSTNFRGSEMVVVIPDEAARISFVAAENLPQDPGEQQTFLRWKLKKTVPFDVDTAQVAFRALGPQVINGGGGAKHAAQDVLVALSPRPVIEEYESLFDALDIQPGIVVPSSLAAMNLYTVPADDSMFVKIAPDAITTSVFQRGRVTFYRKVSGMGLYDSIYPTILYYQDKLGGNEIGSMTVCTYDTDMRLELDALQEKIGIPVQRLEPRNVDDIYKPALGAVHLIWANLI